LRLDFADVPDLYPSPGNFCVVSGFAVWVQHVTFSVLETVNMVRALSGLPIVTLGIQLIAHSNKMLVLLLLNDSRYRTAGSDPDFWD
jgi:hypothetical protein